MNESQTLNIAEKETISLVVRRVLKQSVSYINKCNLFICLCSLFPIGFRYGSDIVPFSKVDEDQMKYKSDGKCFAVLGFTKQELVRCCPADGTLFK